MQGSTPGKLVNLASAVACALFLIILLAQLHGSGSSGSGASARANSLDARLALSDKLWSADVQSRQQMLADVGLGREFPDGYIHPYNVWDFARPSFTCPHELERVGSLGDGGKVVCGMSQYERRCPGPAGINNRADQVIVYSFGVSTDSSFEAALLQRVNARVWGYDYSVSAWSKEIPEIQLDVAKFHRIGVDKTTNLRRDPPMSTVQDLMATNGHTYVDIVKMDIEGAEFDVLTSLATHVGGQPGARMPFGQLLLEIHLMDDPPGFTSPKDLSAWMSWISSLEKLGLRPVNNEDNWIGNVGTGRPRFMEYTFINVLDKDVNKLL